MIVGARPGLHRRVAGHARQVLAAAYGLILDGLGALFTGIAPTTEASAIWVLIIFLLSLVCDDRKLSICYRIQFEASKITTMLMLVLMGANAFTGVFSIGGGV